MENNGVAQGVVATIIIIPLLTVAHIILAAAGCIAAFYIVRGLMKGLGRGGEWVKVKAKKFGGEIRTEAKKIESEKSCSS